MSAKRQRGYEAVAASLRCRMLSGQWPPGARLPAQSELVRRGTASVLTIQRAYRLLARDGYIRSGRRIGSFVTDRPPHLHRLAIHFPLQPAAEGFPHHGFFDAILKLIAAMHARGAQRLPVGRRLAAGSPSIRGSADLPSAGGRARGEPTATLPAAPFAGDLQIDTFFSETAFHTPELERELTVAIRRHLYGGLVLVGTNCSLTPVLVREAAAHEFPLVRFSEVPLPLADQTWVMLRQDWVDRALDVVAQQGRQRVGLLALEREGEAVVQRFARAAAARGLTWRPEWVLAAHEESGVFLRNQMRLLMALPPDRRPDALLIRDDNLVDDATRGLVEGGWNASSGLVVVALLNYPCLPPHHVPVWWVGYDIADGFRRCVTAVRERRRGTRPPHRQWIEAQRLELGEKQRVELAGRVVTPEEGREP